MTFRKMRAFRLALAVTMAATTTIGQAGLSRAAELTPEQRAEYRAKAETASRLVTYGQTQKNAAMLRAAATLMAEIGPVAKEMKDGKPVLYDVNTLMDEAKQYDITGTAAKLSPEITANQCSWFYNCDSYNNCFWDQWC